MIDESTPPFDGQSLWTDLKSGDPELVTRALETLDAGGKNVELDPLSFLAPSMAIMFLAFGAYGLAILTSMRLLVRRRAAQPIEEGG